VAQTVLAKACAVESIRTMTREQFIDSLMSLGEPVKRTAVTWIEDLEEDGLRGAAESHGEQEATLRAQLRDRLVGGKVFVGPAAESRLERALDELTDADAFGFTCLEDLNLLTRESLSDSPAFNHRETSVLMTLIGSR
jgi:hypothetical protein